MIQKKICMVGVYGTGKTCLVQQFVQSIFSVKYLSTVGVKIDRKEVKIGNLDVTLMLWDLEGRDGTHDVNASYVRGAHGVIYVADGTRPDTAQQLIEIRELVEKSVGRIPSVVALNKIDLTEEWKLAAADEAGAGGSDLHRLRTSAKSGEGVEETFEWVARAAVASSGGDQ
ncbi:MAG: Rab family GTPase [Gemmatimonadales bacterium]